jgi:hypothetical protein
MKQEIDMLHIYFRSLKTTEPKFSSLIDQNSLDQFFYTLTQFFFNCRENGFAQADCTAIRFKENNVKEYFITGFVCIQNGMEPLAIEIIMEYLMLLNKTQIITHQELLEMKFIEKTLTLMQHDQIDEYLYLLEKFCSAQILNKIQNELKTKNNGLAR